MKSRTVPKCPKRDILGLKTFFLSKNIKKPKGDTFAKFGNFRNFHCTENNPQIFSLQINVKIWKEGSLRTIYYLVETS